MAALHPNLRKKLEKAVVKARDIAEKAAKSALQSLAVDNHQPFDHMSPDQRQLRVKLRARGRAIGDRIDAKGKQGLWHLIREAAYEHWHRMLFARFLAENNLLMHPDGVAVTLEECEELATEEGLDKWELASRYAAKMLPAIFRPDDPVLQIEFAPEDKLELERLLTNLEPEVFDADDSLGWVYQFWQAKRKNEVNALEAKIGADELPAVTQLFTEDYMVKFLLHNSLGAWWAAKFLAANPKIAQDKELTEDNLRKAVAFDDYHFDFLRFIFNEDENIWKPAAGCVKGWPKEAKDITILDPCCGSGHFLVAVFELMVRIRMVEEGLSAKAAVDSVLTDNLFGLEIDARCTQIAAFALAFTAWKFPKAQGFRELPQLNIACSGIPVTAKKEDWLKLANGDEKLKNGMDGMWTLFRQAPVLGSLIDPAVTDKHELIEASFKDLQPLLEKAIESEKTKADYDLNEAAVAARGIVQAAKILTSKYSLITTNVPYLTRGKQNEELAKFCSYFYNDAKKDLALVFLKRCHNFVKSKGMVAIVTPQNWLFLQSYETLRRSLLSDISLNTLCLLGAGAFETISGEVVNIVLYMATNHNPEKGHCFSAFDASQVKEIPQKIEILSSGDSKNLEQKIQAKNPDARISIEPIGEKDLLLNYAHSFHGQGTFDTCCFSFKFWEVSGAENGWIFQQNTAEKTSYYAGCTSLFRWENGSGMLAKFMEAKRRDGYSSGKWKAGVNIWGQKGVAVSGMTSMYFSIYAGLAFDENVAVIVPYKPDLTPLIWSFCESGEFENAVRKIDRNLKVTCNTLVKIPFDFDKWQKVADEKYPNGLPEPYSNDPTQWIFKGTINDTIEPLHVAVVRLLGYHWPEQSKEPEIEKLIDEDGIVCIPAVRGEQPAADRFRSVLAAAFGDEWSPAKETELLSVADGRRGLEDWLRNRFFMQHCKLFHNRPFIWHIWDGEREGFAALVNYHKLNKKSLETLTYSYLGDWINKQKADFEAGVGPAETKMLAAQVLQKKLQLILRGEKPYDIFARWKPIHEQPIGWEPDLNDGVRMNIRPFFEADALRKKPNIKWKKDRGKDPTREKEQYPWFWNDREFVGERVNDIHLSLKEKQEAREKAAKEGAGK